MSGDFPCGFGALEKCPFCGRTNIKVRDTEATRYDTSRDVISHLTIIVEHREEDCPAGSEQGAYCVRVYDDGSCHAYYY